MSKTTKTVVYGSTEGFLTNNSSIDKRKHERRIAKWRVKGKDRAGRVFTGKTENVSASGVLINVYEEDKCYLNSNDKIFVEIEVVYKSMIRTIEGIAIIRHNSLATSGKRLGVEFIKIKDLERKFLNTYAVGKI
tara:strand:+ start:26449 stop:26850 length:402 start_codon:yes stop_codon:yes gene_type:complete